MRSGLLLGLQLLEGRNTLRVPEDVPPCVPGGTPISAWVNFYTPILHRGHLRVTGPGVPCLRFPGTDWRGVLGACLGCTHTCVHVQPRQRPHAPSSPQKEDQPPPWTTEPQLLLDPCPVLSRFSPQGDLFSAGERDGVPPLADRTVSKKVLAWVHSGWAVIWARIMIPADSPWHRGSPSLPFHSCLARGAGIFLYQNTQLERAGARKDFRLWEWISQKKPTSGRQTNLEVCSYLQRQQPNTSRYWMCNVLALLSPTVRSHCWWSQHGYMQFGIMNSALCTWLEEITARSITNWNSFGVDFFFWLACENIGFVLLKYVHMVFI